MDTIMQDYLTAEIAKGSLAYVRNLVAAEAAVLRGRFNVSKVLRASAHAQRALAMNAARQLGATTDSDVLLKAILEELQSGLEFVADNGNDVDATRAKSMRQSMAVRQRLAEITQEAIESLETNSDVLESDVDQWLYGCYSCGNIAGGDRPDTCDVCGALEAEFEPFGPYYSLAPEHLGQRTPDEIKAIFAKTADRVADAIFDVPDAVLRHRPTPEEWNVKELVGHLIETDQLFVWRVEKILAEPDMPDVSFATAPWKLHEGKGYEDMSASKLVRRLKTSHARSLASIQDLSPEQWCRRGAMNRASRSLIDLGTWVANHDLGHLAQIRRLCQDR